MTSKAPAVAPPSVAPASGSGPAVRPFCRRPTPRPSPTRCDSHSDNERALYGALLPDIVLLRRRGFGVHCEGALFRVGNRLLDAEAVRAVAARERRLSPKS